jgi:membrane-associated protease RseP (regulator of RpoE activity)
MALPVSSRAISACVTLVVLASCALFAGYVRALTRGAREGRRTSGTDSLNVFATPASTAFDPTTGQSPKAAAPSRELAARSECQLDTSITKVSDTHYVVTRWFVSLMLGHPAALARVEPHGDRGHPVGLKLYGIRRNSALGKLGFQNGDLLRNINGISITGPSDVAEAYAKFRDATDLKVGITRDDREIAFWYQIKE